MAPTIVETRPVDLADLTEHPENDRIGDVDRVARSLLTNSQYRPIVVQHSTGLVLAGNHVRRAAALLAEGNLPPMPEGYDDPDAEAYDRVLAEAVARFNAEGYDATVMSTLVECTDDEARAILATDNHTADGSTYDTAASLELAERLAEAGMLVAASLDLDYLDDLRAALEEANAPAATGVSNKATPGELAESYETSGTRSIVIFLGADEYTETQTRLGRLRKVFGVESNTEVVLRLVRAADAEAEANEASAEGA